MYAEPANLTSLVDVFSYANSVSDGIFGVGIMISLYIVVFSYLHLRGEGGIDCALVAGFITSVASVFLLLLNLINGWALFIIFIITALTGVWGYYSKSG